MSDAKTFAAELREIWNRGDYPLAFELGQNEIARLNAEIDRLLDGLSITEGKLSFWRHECDRLREEIAELNQCANAAITDKFREVAKVERLRAKVAELRKQLMNNSPGIVIPDP